MTPRFTNRWHCWLIESEPLWCPGDHKLQHNAALLQQGAFICQHREAKQGPCGRRVYVLQMPYKLRFVAEVTPVEMMAMRDAAMSVDQVLAYLRGSAA